MIKTTTKCSGKKSSPLGEDMKVSYDAKDVTARESLSSYSNNHEDDDDADERVTKLLDQVDFCLGGVFTEDDDDDRSFNLFEEEQKQENNVVEEESNPNVIKFAYQEDETWDDFCHDLPLSEK